MYPEGEFMGYFLCALLFFFFFFFNHDTYSEVTCGMFCGVTQKVWVNVTQSEITRKRRLGERLSTSGWLWAWPGGSTFTA